VRYQAISDTPIDLYTKVTGNRRRATVYIFVSKGYENFITSNSHPIVASNVREFLTSLAQEVQEYKLENQISAQERVVRDARRNHERLVQRQNDLTRDLQRSETNLNNEQTKLDNLRNTRRR